jgi:putative transposase
MKRHTAEEIIPKLRQAEADLAQGLTIAQVCQRLAISEQTLHRWRNQYGGLKQDEAKRLKEREAENARLKRLVAEQAQDKQMLQRELRRVATSRLPCAGTTPLDAATDTENLRGRRAFAERTQSGDSGNTCPRPDSAALRRDEDTSITIDPTLTAPGT